MDMKFSQNVAGNSFTIEKYISLNVLKAHYTKVSDVQKTALLKPAVSKNLTFTANLSLTFSTQSTYTQKK